MSFIQRTPLTRHAHREKTTTEKRELRGGESNPGFPRDRRGYSPLYYRGRNLSTATDVRWSLVLFSRRRTAPVFRSSPSNCALERMFSRTDAFRIETRIGPSPCRDPTVERAARRSLLYSSPQVAIRHASRTDSASVNDRPAGAHVERHLSSDMSLIFSQWESDRLPLTQTFVEKCLCRKREDKKGFLSYHKHI
jgi:hypothetical protein